MSQFIPIIVALIMNGLDLITGMVGAIKNKNLISSKMRDGLFKKLAFIFCYFLSWLVDNYGEAVGFMISIKILPVVILYVCATELVSILENIEKINPNLANSKITDLIKNSVKTKVDTDVKEVEENDKE